jgi:lipopolysaccharide export LptBFGC system permease protein LptF
MEIKELTFMDEGYVITKRTGVLLEAQKGVEVEVKTKLIWETDENGKYYQHLEKDAPTVYYYKEIYVLFDDGKEEQIRLENGWDKIPMRSGHQLNFYFVGKDANDLMRHTLVNVDMDEHRTYNSRSSYFQKTVHKSKWKMLETTVVVSFFVLIAICFGLGLMSSAALGFGAFILMFGSVCYWSYHMSKPMRAHEKQVLEEVNDWIKKTDSSSLAIQESA